MHASFLTWRYRHTKQPKDRSNNAQNRGSSELSRRRFENYKNYVRPHGCHIYNSAADMAMAKMFPCPSQHHEIPHWKCVLLLPGVSIPHQETNIDETNTCSTVCFLIPLLMYIQNLLTPLKMNLQIIKKMIKIQLQTLLLTMMLNNLKHKDK